MNCAICNKQAPDDMDDVIEQGWIPGPTIINSVLEGHPEWPVVLGDHVTLINSQGTLVPRPGSLAA
jgi:hypothetical protein